jgi:hypothetical protein
MTCAKGVHDISENDAEYTSTAELKDGNKTFHRIRTYNKSATRHKPNQSMFFKMQSVICDAEKIHINLRFQTVLSDIEQQ